MPELVLFKADGNTLLPADARSAALLNRLKRGAGIRVRYEEVNDIGLHRKMMALFQLAFDAWQPTGPRYLGYVIEKEFDQLRKDLVILAGYYERYTDPNGNTRLNAQSLAFDSMEAPTREALFSALIDVVLKHILPTYNKADIDNVIAQTLGFAR